MQTDSSKSARIAVTGATGRVGAPLVEILEQRGRGRPHLALQGCRRGQRRGSRRGARRGRHHHRCGHGELLLSQEPGRAFSAREILCHLWETDYVGDGSACTTHVSNLRHKIERDRAAPERLVTVPGAGYALVG